MYKRKPTPKDIRYIVNDEVTPEVYLEDEYGGKSIIYIDDGCFVLANISSQFGNNIYFSRTYHWYPEAIKALQSHLLDTWFNEHRSRYGSR